MQSPSGPKVYPKEGAALRQEGPLYATWGTLARASLPYAFGPQASKMLPGDPSSLLIPHSHGPHLASKFRRLIGLIQRVFSP